MSHPNVVYDFERQHIGVDVVVEEDQIVAGLPVLRPGQWKVTWHLISSLDVIFDPSEGIQIDDGANAPPELTHEAPEWGSDKAVSVNFHNRCQSANAVSYFINLLPGSAASSEVKERWANLPLHHDPTISVVSDPPSG